jgi:hypothetical protein
MISPFPFTDSEIQVKARVLAGAALAHPLALQLTGSTVSALAEIASSGEPLAASQRRLLHGVLALLDAAEIAASRRIWP